MTRSTGLFLATTTAALVLALVLSVIAGGSTAQAVPQRPHNVYGNVFIGTDTSTAALAVVGTAIQARIDNVNFANSFDTGRNTKTDAGGKYDQVGGSNFHVCGNTTDIAGKQGGDFGDVITFVIANKLAVARDAFGNVVDPVLFQPGKTTLLNLYQSTTAAPTVVSSGDACKIGTELPTPIPTVTPLPSGDGDGTGAVDDDDDDDDDGGGAAVTVDAEATGCGSGHSRGGGC